MVKVLCLTDEKRKKELQIEKGRKLKNVMAEEEK